MNKLPDALPGPFRIVMKDGFIGWKIAGQQIPLAAGFDDIKNAIEDVAARVLARSSSQLWGGHEPFYLLPLFVIKIGRVVGFGNVHPKSAL